MLPLIRYVQGRRVYYISEHMAHVLHPDMIYVTTSSLQTVTVTCRGTRLGGGSRSGSHSINPAVFANENFRSGFTPLHMPSQVEEVNEILLGQVLVVWLSNAVDLEGRSILVELSSK